MEAEYDFKEAELYGMCRLAWSMCERNLSDFYGFSPMYDQTYIEQMLDEIDRVEELPDDDARKNVPTTIRQKLVVLKEDFLDRFALLKRYIAKAYPKNIVEIKLDAAGQAYEEGAGKCNWESLQSLMTNAVAFAANNSADLEANNNMQPSFIGSITPIVQEFQQQLLEYQIATGESVIATSKKIEGNNALLVVLKDLLGDAKAVFRRKKVLQEQFTLASLKRTVSGVSSAGFGGRITMPITKKGIKDAKITIVEKERTVTTDNTGRFEIRQLAAGKYTIIIQAEGYQDVTKLEQTVNVGRLTRVNEEMVRV